MDGRGFHVGAELWVFNSGSWGVPDVIWCGQNQLLEHRVQGVHSRWCVCVRAHTHTYTCVNVRAKSMWVAYLVIIFYWEITAALDSHLLALFICFLRQSIPFPFVFGHFLPLKSTSLFPSPGDPFIYLCGYQHLCFGTHFQDPCSSIQSNFTTNFLFLLLNAISGNFFSSQNCPQRLKWVKSHQEERSVIKKHNWKGYIRHLLL